MVRTDTQRLSLRRIYAAFVAGDYATFTAALQDYAFASFEAVKGGAILSTTANGQSVTFASGGASPSDFAEMFGRMLDLYDAARAALIAAGTAAPADADIFTEMLDRIRPIRETTNDFTELRCPS